MAEVNFNATNCTTMGDNTFPVFYGCTSLTTINIGNNVQSIPDYAFSGCSALTSITIPSSVTRIGNEVFKECTALAEVNFNATNCTTMGSFYHSVFPGCTSLTTVAIGSNVQNIPDYAFNGCRGLNKVIIPDIAAWCRISFASIAASPLYYAHHLYCDRETEITDLVIPNSVTSISFGAFNGCSGLKSVTIPNSVTSIGKSAFSDCTGLTSVTIPNSVTSIGGGAFGGCM